MGHVPMNYGIDPDPSLSIFTSKASGIMGLTAEMIALKYKVSREDQDEFALRSQIKATEATKSGRFLKEIVSIEGHNSEGNFSLINEDEVIRPDSTLNELAKLKPLFNPVSGTVTVGNSSAISDGASAILMMSLKKAKEYNL